MICASRRQRRHPSQPIRLVAPAAIRLAAASSRCGPTAEPGNWQQFALLI